MRDKWYLTILFCHEFRIFRIQIQSSRTCASPFLNYTHLYRGCLTIFDFVLLEIYRASLEVTGTNNPRYKGIGLSEIAAGIRSIRFPRDPQVDPSFSNVSLRSS